MKRKRITIAAVLVILSCILLIIYGQISDKQTTQIEAPTTTQTQENIASTTEKLLKEEEKNTPFDICAIPLYKDKPFVVVNNNIPYFTDEDYTTKSFERYTPLDAYGRCGECFACVGTDLMPTEKRGDISSVKPTGWHSIKYDCVDGKSLYNRCHLIGFQLSGENANKENLITGTRYLNVDGMLPFENMVADYVKETDNHVMYRITPIFEGKNLIATGVLMEGYSVEDDGEGICFNVFCYNAQPQIKVNYSTGESELIKAGNKEDSNEIEYNGKIYVLNTKSRKFHLSDCPSIVSATGKNIKQYTGNREELVDKGYSPCKNCNP